MAEHLKIKRQAASLRHQVQETLRQEIVSGRLAPGERLVEQRLCEALDVSRTSLREALRRLEAEGLIELVPHRGAVVASVDLGEARQIYDVRGVLETLAVRGFAEQATEEDIAELRGVLSELENAQRCGSPGPSVLVIKQRFYRVLLDACGNDIVRGMLEMLNNRISFLRSLSLSQAGRLPDTVREIREIVEAIERRDTEAAHAASLRHVESAASNALATLRQREFRGIQSNRD